MTSVLQIIRLLVIIQVLRITRCQDGFSEQDLLRLQQMASNDGQIEAITSYSANIIHREPNSQSLSQQMNNQPLNSPDLQYQGNDNANKNNYGRTFYSRSKKVYRIKNPFQSQVDDAEKQKENSESHDSGTGASNQYSSVQYSLPPEEFLQQMRAENQYYQQSQSTPAPNIGYTATPQPQYQYSTVSPLYDNNQHANNQIPLEPKVSHGSTYLSSPSPYQYSTPNTFFDNVQSSPSPLPPYLSTALNNGQFGTQSNSYVSSASPIFLSSPPNLQSYVSSPLSVIQTGSPDYGNRVTTTIGNNALNYDTNDSNKKMQIDHFDYAANGVRYPVGMPQQYQNEYASTTTTTNSPPYSEQLRDSWQNVMNSNMNAAPKSAQENLYNQYNNYVNNNPDVRVDNNAASTNSDTHRISNIGSSNNFYANYMQPESQALQNFKLRTRDTVHDTNQPELYSNGDFGWKLTGKKPLIDVFSSGNYQKYSPANTQSDSVAVSQMNFHMDTSKRYGYEPVSKSATETIEAQEFAKAAANAHERIKQQQQYQQLYSNNNYASMSDTNTANSYYNNDKQKNKYPDHSNTNSYYYGNAQNDLITASPYYLQNTRDTLESKLKFPFDHDKALKNIVPIDVSNVVSNFDSPVKSQNSMDNSGRYTSDNYGKDPVEQVYKQYIRPVTDSFYKDKNSIYGFNIKNKPEEYLLPDTYKQLESSMYNKQQQPQASNYNQVTYPGSSQSFSYLSQGPNQYQDNVQSPSIQQVGLQRNQNQMPSDIASILKFDDVPYKLTQNLHSDALKLNNLNYDQGSIPSSLPVRLNQNVGSHQIDVTTNILNKMLQNKQPNLNLNRPEIDNQGLLSTINGFKVANPFNVDLKLVSEMLKGKPAIDDSHLISLRDQYTKPAPLKLDFSQLQYLLKNENPGNIAPLNDGIGTISSAYLDLYNNARYPPYQGVKYSRSQEEEESLIPIADASNTHPIGAVIEQEWSASEREVSGDTDLTAQDDEIVKTNFDNTRSKNRYISSTRGERNKHPNLLISGRQTRQRKYPKADVEEPYPLLKPPPPKSHPGRSGHAYKDKHRRRLVNKPKLLRVYKTEPLFEADAEDESIEHSVPILLRPPKPKAQSKSDTVAPEEGS